MTKLKIQNRHGDGMGNMDVEPAYPSYVSGKISPASMSPEVGYLRGYLESAAKFDIDTAPVVEYLARVRELEAEAAKVGRETFPDDRRQGLIDSLASGDTTPARALKDFGRSDRGEFNRVQAARVGLLEDAAARARRFAVVDVTRNVDSIVHLLRVVVQEAVESLDAGRYSHAVDLYGRLLGWALPTADGATADEWKYARPDLVWGWKLERAESVVEVGQAGSKGDTAGGKHARMFVNPVGAPEPTLEVIAAHADEWRPSLFSAEQVVANARTFAPV